MSASGSGALFAPLQRRPPLRPPARRRLPLTPRHRFRRAQPPPHLCRLPPPPPPRLPSGQPPPRQPRQPHPPHPPRPAYPRRTRRPARSPRWTDRPPAPRLLPPGTPPSPPRPMARPPSPPCRPRAPPRRRDRERRSTSTASFSPPPCARGVSWRRPGRDADRQRPWAGLPHPVPRTRHRPPGHRVSMTCPPGPPPPRRGHTARWRPSHRRCPAPRSRFRPARSWYPPPPRWGFPV